MSDRHDLTTVVFNAMAESRAVRRKFLSASTNALIDASEHMALRLAKGGKILVFGNGGSASDASHFVGELVGRFLMERPGLPAMALGCDPATVTAIANDYGYDKVFARQVEALARPHDVVLGISTSGRSRNVLAGLEAAQGMDVLRIGLVGNRDCPMAENCHILLSCGDIQTCSARIQETHIFALHLLVDLVERQLQKAGEFGPDI